MRFKPNVPANLLFSTEPVDCEGRVPALARSPDLTWSFVFAEDERLDASPLGTAVAAGLSVRRSHSYAGHVGENLRWKCNFPQGRRSGPS